MREKRATSFIALIFAFFVIPNLSAQSTGQDQANAAGNGQPAKQSGNSGTSNGLQQAATTAPNPQSTATPSPSPVKLKVDCVLPDDGKTDVCPNSSNETATLESHVRLKVSNLSQWIAANNSAQKLALFLNGRQVGKTAPSVFLEQNVLVFDLERISSSGDTQTDKLAEAWDDLILHEKNQADWLWHGVSRSVHPSVGVDGGNAEASDAVFTLVFLSTFWVYICLIFWLGTLAGLIVLAKRSDILKDDPNGAYSLARTQMAIWTWLILSGYFFLFIMFWNPAVNIPASMLGLLGISATTYVCAVLVDKRSGPSTAPSKGFWKDISGPDQGVQLHRIQIIAWTVVLSFVYIVRVFTKLSIPDFNPTLLGLLGLSAGTYVGFKFPENQTTPPANPNAQGQNPAPANPNPQGQNPPPPVGQHQ